MSEGEPGIFLQEKVSIPDSATRLMKQLALRHSIATQKSRLKKIDRESTPQDQRQEAQRMLKVIDYYQVALKDPGGQTLKLEVDIVKRLQFLWEILQQHGKFDFNLPNPKCEIEFPLEREKIEVTFRKLKEDENPKHFLFAVDQETEPGQVIGRYAATQFFLQIQPKGEQKYRRASINLAQKLDEGGKQRLTQVDLRTEGFTGQRAILNFVGKGDHRIITSSPQTEWKPTRIEDVSGWEGVETLYKMVFPGIPKLFPDQKENYALALGITKELIEATEVSREEIEGLLENEKRG